jgi:hypothetical protein
MLLKDLCLVLFLGGKNGAVFENSVLNGQQVSQAFSIHSTLHKLFEKINSLPSAFIVVPPGFFFFSFAAVITKMSSVVFIMQLELSNFMELLEKLTVT